MNRSLRSAVVYAALCLPWIVIYVGIFRMQEPGLSLSALLWDATTTLLPPMLAGPALWWLSGRVPLETRHRARSVALHLVLMLLFAVGWGFWIVWLMRAPAGGASVYARRFVLPWQLLMGVFMYGLITAVSYALRGVARSRDLLVAAERAEKLRAQAELAALRAHINPHFLFNALHAVSQLQRVNPSRAEEALERLSDLFRYVLRLDRERAQVVSLEDEWQFTQSYLWLEQMRMGERLQVSAEFDDEALGCVVPPFTLQPLVENAVRHGLAPKRAGGSLRVHATGDGHSVTIEVRDDGVGAPPDVARQSSGVGVRAVMQRLEARHGAAFRAEIDTAPDRGFVVRLHFPSELRP